MHHTIDDADNNNNNNNNNNIIIIIIIITIIANNNKNNNNSIPTHCWQNLTIVTFTLFTAMGVGIPTRKILGECKY